MRHHSDIQIWLKPLTGARRPEQSHSVRLLLQQACEARGITLPRSYLSLSGLALIKNIRKQHNLSVSLAHCSNMAVLALGSGTLGLDCEQNGKNRRWREIAQQFFTAEEAKKIRSAPTQCQESEFLRHWVLKEAYIKANHGSVFGDLNRLALNKLDRVVFTPPESMENISWGLWYANYGEFHLGIFNRVPTTPKLQFFRSDPDHAQGYTDITVNIPAALLSHS